MKRLSPAEAERFILANTTLGAPPHVPEIRLHLADEAHELWERTEEELVEIGLPPPFWAFAWAGGQGLARYVLDHPACVACRRVLDFAAGSGLVGIAAKKSGAASVESADIDPFSQIAMRLNAAANGVVLEPLVADLIDSDMGWDVVLAGDIFYQKDIVDRLVPWFTRLRMRGCEIIVGDPGRAYLPKDRLEQLAEYRVPVTRALEDAEVKRTVVWRFA
ncbi:MAG: methyltransferase [Rhizobiaceae bacterium]|nr:methyltransferase [Rhizobiaceae bacterium]